MKNFSKAWMLSAFVALSTSALSQDNNTVDVFAPTRESRRPRTTGQTRIITPSGESRADANIHLGDDPSIDAPMTGQPAAAGFSVPRIRAQDAQLSEIYIGHTLIQDPFTGLPMIDQVDLRAFDGLEISRGLSSWRIPSANPIGALQFVIRPQTRDSEIQLGGKTGKPFGHLGWFKGTGQHETNSKTSITSRIYGRSHQASGNFPYYNDNGTPYNVSDDKVSLRENNDSRSTSVIPMVQIKSEKFSSQLAVMETRTARGIPGRGSAPDTATRENSITRLGLAEFETRHFGIGGSVRSTRIATRDPNQDYLGSSRDGLFQTDSRGGFVFGRLDTPWVDLVLRPHAEVGEGRIRYGADGETNLARRNLDALYAGILFGKDSVVSGEIKVDIRKTHNRSDSETVTHNATNRSAAISFNSDVVVPYAQIGKFSRPPALLEQFGNGSSIAPADDLSPEDTLHREVGAKILGFSPWVRFYISSFDDAVDNKISFVPTIGQAVIATNLRDVHVRGYEFATEIAYRDWMVDVAYARIDAKNLDLNRRVPKVPRDAAVVSAGFQNSLITPRWRSRYRGEVARDMDNSIEQPGVVLHDATLDGSWHLSNATKLNYGLEVRNVFNTMSVDIDVPNSPENKGRTALADEDGFPLPGRSLAASVSVDL